MKHADIRNKYLDFFKAKGHALVPSDSLVPAGDKSLLFTSAGMAQFKNEFMGHIKDFTRAVTCQKCMRTGDLENVGKTAYHHTFFEMLGNFSFGDYFKDEAIAWAWEFLKDVLKVPEKRLWASVYEEDDEAYNIWKDKIQIPQDRIVKLGQKDNFWPSEAKDKGPNGPCGPCSEIFYDYGEDAGCGKAGCSPACSCGRFVEIWNLVFTQFERRDDGTLVPLPNKNIDTGMGLERLCAVMQGVRNNFETDIFSDIIEAIIAESGIGDQSFGSGDSTKPAKEYYRFDIYKIADHIRAITFAIADGVAPSNEERGYVIRSLIRRAMMCAKKIGVEKAFLYKLVYTVASSMQEPYPELMKEHQDIAAVIKTEEEKFLKTLENGISITTGTLNMLSDSGLKEISGNMVFELYDTHGIPLEIIKETATAQGYDVDEDGFNNLMQIQRETSRKSSKMQGEIFATGLIKARTEFIGYDAFESSANVIEMMDKNGRSIKEADISTGLVEIILDRSVFYGESGGQVGDKGKISKPGAEVIIKKAGKVQDAIVLIGNIEKGDIRVGDKVKAEIDIGYRLAIARNHTATHLLQKALRKVLGEHVKQQGSLVTADRLRFDFTHSKALTDDELSSVEELVNKDIKDNHNVRVEETSLQDAKSSGALAFFGDKYNQKVRVVYAGTDSRELCGGTHLENTLDIELFRISHEGSVASGIRRIEACTADRAREWEAEHKKKEQDKERILEEKKQEKFLEKKRLKELEHSVDTIIEGGRDIQDVKLIIQCIDNQNMGVLKHLSDVIKNKFKQGCLLFFVSSQQGKASMLLSLSDSLSKRGLDASTLLSEILKPFGGKAGGRPNMAQGGIKDLQDTGEVLKIAEKVLVKELG